MSEQTLITIIMLGIAAHGALGMFATLKLNNNELLYPFQKFLWLAFIWCVPVLGATALHLTYRVAWGGHAEHGGGIGISTGEGGGGCDGGS